VLVLPLSGCGLFGSDTAAQDAATRFLDALAKGDNKAAGKLTDSADSATELLDQVRSALEPESVRARVDRVTEDGSNATVSFSATWNFGESREWNYTGRFGMRSENDAWTVHWEPAVVHPKLAAQQSMDLQVDEPEFAPVLDRDGQVVLEPNQVVSVLFDPAKAGDAPAVAGALAAALSGFDATITQQSILDGAAKVEAGTPYQVAALRWNDYELVKPRIYELPGVRFTSGPRLLAADKAFAPTLLPGIRKVVEADLAGKTGWRVITIDVSGAEVEELYAKPAEPAKAAVTTLSTTIQNAAQATLATEPTPSMIVAMQPSTGELLAVAQNAAADAQGALALTGRYPPGSTFKIVTASAALLGGTVTATTPVGCPASITVDGRPIPNNDDFAKGMIPLHDAFAFSCNTTFADLASKMGPSDLTDTAKQFGLGVDFVMPGATTVTGSVPPATNVVERAEDGFGQGKVVASPFGMALVASTVVTGTAPTPTLLRDKHTTADTEAEPVDPAVLVAVRDMMHRMARGQPALAPFPEVRGKTGTAQFGDGTQSHAWFVGYQGDLAFGVLLSGAGGSSKAVAATSRFLAALAS
jgi:beta-lactamase class D